VRAPAVLVAPGELQRDEVPGDAELALEPLPGRTLSDPLPPGPLHIVHCSDAADQTGVAAGEFRQYGQ
jgi:hypothetical protein